MASNTTEFTLTDRDFENTVLLDTTGRALYHTDTKLLQFVSRETKLFRAAPQHPSGEALIGTITLSGWHDHSVVVNSRNVTPARMRMMSVSETWAASDGRLYKWKVEMGDFTLVDDETKQIVAFFERHNVLSSKASKVHVNPQGLPILDEIIATLVYMVRVQRRRERRRNNR
ncbi:hypothetical protein BD626DRAFT_465455 [Schizophyllum amplum]|uniref:DUF6593 domain-containing protein n=1 Tax=Schizophyllum amplum TaxID=97359 RepID=A0A550BX90_9AGAR|nr:hypothetical protein BD626DRAFT_465455 [Auriculariopsis ampla]